MHVADDSERIAASLGRRLDELTFQDATTDQVTELIIDAVVGWARAAGWRVYRRASSVLPLPPPLSGQYSVLDVACARPAGPPVVIEVDHTDRRRTVEKLLAEAAAGRVAIWVRWGTGRFVAPPPPVGLVTCVVTRRSGPAGQGRLYSRVPADDRPPPAHSGTPIGSTDAVALPIPTEEGDRLPAVDR
ncbi:hypothetical protein [Micromonospora echinofusca]|uniref:Uncharacterized protein n=1 Tax=Micromonospora echinofusca TaxID=47858 RepID=A0ABS3VNJ8_MICEH|nr:hypothetical protein [Micromonospora echinofusca]MBO4206077.1 hypothetical protein [Micromonospora echinofusca]